MATIQQETPRVAIYSGYFMSPGQFKSITEKLQPNSPFLSEEDIHEHLSAYDTWRMSLQVAGFDQAPYLKSKYISLSYLTLAY